MGPDPLIVYPVVDRIAVHRHGAKAWIATVMPRAARAGGRVVPGNLLPGVHRRTVQEARAPECVIPAVTVRKVPERIGTATFTSIVKMKKPVQNTPVATIHSFAEGR